MGNTDFVINTAELVNVSSVLKYNLIPYCVHCFNLGIDYIYISVDNFISYKLNTIFLQSLNFFFDDGDSTFFRIVFFLIYTNAAFMVF